MANAINIAGEMQAYVLTDRGTGYHLEIKSI